MIRAAIIALAALPLSGCASLWFAGISDYQLVMPDGVTISIYSGKEEQAVSAALTTTDTGYVITLKESGVKAFQGQAVAGSAASDVAAATASGVVTALKTIK
jgi:hypothetical protein